MRVLLLGADGTVGSVALRDLVRSDIVMRIVATYHTNVDRLRKVAGELASDKVELKQLNVENYDKLVGSCKEADVVANAVYYKHVLPITKAAVEAGTDYVDLGGLIFTEGKQLELDEAAKDAGVTAVTCMGVSVGLTQVLAKHGSNKLDKTNEIFIRTGVIDQAKAPIDKFAYSADTILDEIGQEAYIYQDGKYESRPPLTGEEKIRFLEPVGEATGYYCKHSEVFTIPRRIPGLKYVDFKLAVPSELVPILKFIQWFVTREPINVDGVSLSTRDLLLKLVGAAPDVPRKDAIACKVTINGEKNSKQTRITYDTLTLYYDKWNVTALSYATAIPFSATTQMLLEGAIKKKGVLTPEEINIEDFLNRIKTYENYCVKETIQTEAEIA